MTEQVPSEQCCDSWRKAQQLGTDNEMYGMLLRDYSGTGADWHVGCDLPAVRFCPWCGAKKDE